MIPCWKILSMICRKPLPKAIGLLRTSKKYSLGGKNCSKSSGPEKMLNGDRFETSLVPV